MAITIKEIYVKTTVIRHPGTIRLPDEVVGQLRESILRELQEEERKKIKRKNER